MDTGKAGPAGGRHMETIAQHRDPEDWADFEAAAKRPLEQHIHNSFIHTYKPVLDDAEYRSFDTMAEYREWCERNVPDWLGYGRV
jgi:hypothetical protein